jgi:hypothetical protein
LVLDDRNMCRALRKVKEQQEILHEDIEDGWAFVKLKSSGIAG